jgi:two-component system, LytTR family, response regulator
MNKVFEFFHLIPELYKMMHCLIVDDEQHSIDILCQYVLDTPYLKLVKSTTDPFEAMDIVNSGQVDLIFLDIEMPRLNGKDLLLLLRGKCHIIICSAFRCYAVDGFENDVIDYLLKPVSYKRFLKSTQKAAETVGNKPDPLKTASAGNDFIFVKTGIKGKAIKVSFTELDYVESLKNYVTFYEGKREIVTYMKISDVETLLPKDQFIRIHKSFIVRINRISMIDGNCVVLNNTTRKIPVSNSFKERLLQLLGITDKASGK